MGILTFPSILLERALRALASSSGGAACPGHTQGQPMATASIGQITEHVFIVRDAAATLIGLKSELTTGRLRDSKIQV